MFYILSLFVLFGFFDNYAGVKKNSPLHKAILSESNPEQIGGGDYRFFNLVDNVNRVHDTLPERLSVERMSELLDAFDNMFAIDESGGYVREYSELNPEVRGDLERVYELLGGQPQMRAEEPVAERLSNSDRRDRLQAIERELYNYQQQFGDRRLSATRLINMVALRLYPQATNVIANSDSTSTPVTSTVVCTPIRTPVSAQKRKHSGDDISPRKKRRTKGNLVPKKLFATCKESKKDDFGDFDDFSDFDDSFGGDDLFGGLGNGSTLLSI